jgi:Uma2 family endonuclease
MKMVAETRLMTAEELFRLPDDGMRRELVRGELRTMAPTGGEHGELGIEIGASLLRPVRAQKLGRVFGDTGFILAENPDLVRAPDVAFVGRERPGGATRVRGFIPGAPDLAVEVVSPNDLYTDVADKVAEYLEHGTRMVLVVNPRRKEVLVHRPGASPRVLTIDDAIDGEDVVPGWTLPLRELFEDE